MTGWGGKKKRKRWPQTAWLSTSHCFQHFLNISQCFTCKRSDETKEKVKLWLKTAMLVLYLRTLFGRAPKLSDIQKRISSAATSSFVSSVFSSKPGEAEGLSYVFIFHQPARDCCHGLEYWVCYFTCLCLCVVGFTFFFYCHQPARDCRSSGVHQTGSFLPLGWVARYNDIHPTRNWEILIRSGVSAGMAK